MDVNGNYVLINDNDSNTVSYNGSDANVSLNWVEEKDRRNYSWLGGHELRSRGAGQQLGTVA